MNSKDNDVGRKRRRGLSFLAGMSVYGFVSLITPEHLIPKRWTLLPRRTNNNFYSTMINSMTSVRNVSASAIGLVGAVVFDRILRTQRSAETINTRIAETDEAKLPLQSRLDINDRSIEMSHAHRVADRSHRPRAR